MARRRKTVALSDLADAVLRAADPNGKRFEAAAVEAWDLVVGPEIAHHTRGFAMRERGELVVSVDNPAWANQLSAMSATLTERLNAQIGHNAVRTIRFTVSRRVETERALKKAETEALEYYERDDVHPVPLDPVELRQAEHVAASIKQPGLREITLRVMVRDLERKKGRRQALTEGPGTAPHTDPEDGP